MSDTPFWDKARELAQSIDYIDMSAKSDRALSHGWWRRLVLDGPWGEGSGAGRVNPPSPEKIDGIAKLFGTTSERVAQMIAADWYGVQRGIGVSDRVLNLSHVIDRLTDGDAALVEEVARRLAPPRRTVMRRAPAE
jgi:hypothetical protein